jgi:hypothetical protein
MKLKLLLIGFILCGTMQCFAQATVHQLLFVAQCHDSIFDLTFNTPMALLDQSPNEYTVTYHVSQADADNNTNVITDPHHFATSQQTTTIYLRVTNNSNGDFDVDSFSVYNYTPHVYQFDDIHMCSGSHTLTDPEHGHYYTGPGGTGTMLAPGTQITNTQLIYVYDRQEGCEAETSFTVIVGSGLEVNRPTPLLVCQDDTTGQVQVDLTSKINEITGDQRHVSVLFYITESDAMAAVNPIATPQNYTSQLALPYHLYVRVQNEETGCFEVMTLIIEEGECTSNVISGIVSYDIDNNGCTSADIPAANAAVYYRHNDEIYYTYTNNTGHYSFTNVPDGDSEVTLANYGTDAVVVAFPGNEASTNFCFTIPNPVNDVSVYLFPISTARPGMPAYYMLTLQNLGNLPASGTVTVQFDAGKLTLNFAPPLFTQSGNLLTYNYTNLQPYQTETISLTFMMMENGLVNLGDILSFTASITPLEGDVNPYDNTTVVEQVVVDSLDPNDIAVCEGEFITEEQADNYLHYTIRFQNTGTADALNIRIESELDDTLDWDTFEPVAASATYQAKREGANLEFKFSNINLPGMLVNEPDSHGFISYRIKPKANVQLGDSMQASANIFFDGNTPVATNVVTTTIQNQMGIEANAITGFRLYPNPANNNVTLHMADNANADVDVIVADVLGKIVISNKMNLNNNSNLDVSSLTSGMYFITVSANGKSTTKKLILE